MIKDTVLEILELIDYRYGLYIFKNNKLLIAKPYTIEGKYKNDLSGVSFYDSPSGETHMYLDLIRDEYLLYGNILFEKDMCVKDRQVLNSVVSIDYNSIVDFCDSDGYDVIKRLKKLNNPYIYREKDDKTKANKTSKNNNDVINKAVKAMKNNKEQNTMKNNFSDIINMKMMMGIINNKGEIDLTKLMVLQSFAKDGTIEVTDIIKTKLTEKILKDTKSTEDLPLEKLALINMLDNGNLDLQEIIKYKMLSSDDMDMEKMMMMSCMTNGGDITDIIKYKMMTQMLKETDTETK